MTIHQILKNFWGYDNFRPLQQEIIEAVLSGKDTLALLPTSGGKSICFQVPALAMDGICIVVTPLIALMKNQVENLKTKGLKAVAIHTGMHRHEIDATLDNCIYGDIKFLYISPERLTSPLFLERAKKMKVCLLAVDEAHCVSQWGYDFRPTYLKIGEFKSIIPNAKFIALTASATKEVKADIIEKLNFKNTAEFRLSFARKNISYSVIETEDKDKKLLEILNNVKGSGIIYVRSRKRAKSTSDWLNSKGFSTDFYHAGLPHESRNKKQDEWIKGRTTIIVATNAFGMGIDKATVRLVLHIDLPESLEAYYQEAGRAGRDELKAYAVILYNLSDTGNLLEKITDSYPEIDYLKRVYQMLANYFHIPVGGAEGESYPIDMAEFQRNFDLKSTDLFHALKLLQDENFIVLSEAFNNPSKIQIIVTNSELYDFRLRNEKYDSFIKLLLRMYGGEIFSDLQTISEQNIAKQYMIPVSEVGKMLDFLAIQNIIVYNKQSQLPYITYITPRYDSKLLPIKTQQISFRKNRDLINANAIISYVSNQKICRSKQILSYFNEIVEEDCGTCDICIAKKKLENNSSHFELEKYKNQIFALLITSPMRVEQLINTLAPKSKNLFISAIQLLLEEGKIKYDQLTNLHILK